MGIGRIMSSGEVSLCAVYEQEAGSRRSWQMDERFVVGV